MGGGHYTAFCKNFIDRKWYEFNDSRVREISPKDVVTEDAYVLFFRRRDWTGIYYQLIFAIEIFIN